MSVKRYLIEFNEADGSVRIYEKWGFYTPVCKKFKSFNNACIVHIMALYQKFLKDKG